MDLVGHGGSAVGKTGQQFHFKSIYNDIVAIFDRFAKKKNVVIAHSYG